MIDWWLSEVIAIFNVVVIDIVLAGDNAIVVGLAASRVAPDIRSRVIFWGIAGAVILRVLLAGVTAQLLTIVGLTLAGGILLLWVCWKMYRQLSMAGHDGDSGAVGAARTISFRQAVTQVVLADVTMSLDNVLAVAGAAKGSLVVLALGLAVGVVLMAVASHAIARLLTRHPWLTWVGLGIVVFVALSMIWDGWHEVDRALPAWNLEALRGAIAGGSARQ